jgi:4-hydroxy-tetrahydrodipicolinate reductase
MKNKNEKYKVIVWGPGKMGSYAMYHFIQSEEFELVGVRGYYESEIGVDVGTYLGIDPIGLTISGNEEELLALDCDCVVYVVHEDVTYQRNDEELLRILNAGKNVVTTQAYHNLQNVRDDETIQKFKDACENNNVTFFAGGVDPDIISDRMLLSMAGACADIKQAKITEVWDVSTGAKEPLQILGYGKTVEEASKNTHVFASAVNFQKTVVYTAEEDFGVKFDRVVESHEFHVTDEDIEEPWLIKKGTVGRVTHHMDGYVDSISKDEPFFKIDIEWYFTKKMLPENVNEDDNYILTIEGTPSLCSHISFKESNINDKGIISFGNRKLTPNYIVTIMSIINAIPTVVEAEKGLMPSIKPQVHWMKDIRNSIK